MSHVISCADRRIGVERQELVTLRAELAAAQALSGELAAALRAQGNRDATCWCGDQWPNGDTHSEWCQQATAALSRTPEQAGERWRAMVAVVEAARERTKVLRGSEDETEAVVELVDALAALDSTQ